MAGGPVGKETAVVEDDYGPWDVLSPRRSVLRDRRHDAPPRHAGGRPVTPLHSRAGASVRIR